MSEHLTRDLKAFTPAGLDRDAVLFAAGRASAPRRTGWKWLAGGLGVSNLMTLGVMLWPKPTPEVPPPAVPPPVVEPDSTPPHPFSYVALTWGGEPPPSSDAGPHAPAAPLTPRAFDDPHNW